MRTQLRRPTPHRHSVVALFDREEDVVQAVRSLHQAGFHEDQISLLAKDRTALASLVGPDAQVLSEREITDALAEESEPKGRDEFTGMALGGAVGFVIGLAAIAIPGIGPALLAAGPAAAAAYALSFSGGGLGIGMGMGAILGAILDENVTEDHRRQYQEELEKGHWMMVVHGDDADLAQVHSHLQNARVDHHT